MEKHKLVLVLGALALAMLGACADDDGAGDPDGGTPKPDAMVTFDAPPGSPDAGPMNVDVGDDITADTTWTYPNTYFLKKHVFVKGGATLTIEPGVIVKGDLMTSLVVTREGKIDATGTAERPIVFTSVKPAGQQASGDWGGIVLLGKAKINDTAGDLGIEGFPAGTADVLYGGSDDTHDCGTLRYVRVEFAGYVLEANKELNGISVGACGSQTELDFIQIHKGNDDGIEFFGGTASIKHLVADQGLDDGIDWDFGWTGKAQFVIVQLGNGDGEHGIEADNHPSNFDLMPRAKPTLYNVTIVGPSMPAGKTKVGMMFRRGTGVRLFNGIIFNVDGIPIDVDNDASTMLANGTDLFVKNSIFFGNGGQMAWDDSEAMGQAAFNEGQYFLGMGMDNLTSDPALGDPTSLTAPNFQPAANSPALVSGNAATPPNDGFFDTSATFVGAVGSTDWTAGWTAYP
jgi:hypothetical protein